MTSTETVAATVTRLIRANLNDTTLEITPDSRPAEIAGWDSIKMVDIILDCEDAFDIRLSASDIEQFHTVAALIMAVEAQLAADAR